MKTFLRYASGVIAALLLIYFWPAHRYVRSVHLWESGTFQNPTSVRPHGDSIDFDVSEDDGSVTRHIHWHGSYWIDYSDSYVVTK